MLLPFIRGAGILKLLEILSLHLIRPSASRASNNFCPVLDGSLRYIRFAVHTDTLVRICLRLRESRLNVGFTQPTGQSYFLLPARCRAC